MQQNSYIKDTDCNNLRSKRCLLKMTQREMAERLGISRAYYAAVESGLRPYTKSLMNSVESLSDGCKREDTIDTKCVENDVICRLKKIEDEIDVINRNLLKLIAMLKAPNSDG